MERIKVLLIPTGIGILLVILGHISSIMDAGFKTARTGPGATGDFLVEFVGFFVLVVVVLVFFKLIQDVA